MISIIDAHLDLAWNALSWNRDLTLPLNELNRTAAGMTDHPARGRATVSLAEMRRGRIDVCLGTLLARCKPQVRPPEGHTRRSLDFATQDIACANAHGQLVYYRALEQRKLLYIITTASQLQQHWRDRDSSPPGLIVAMEGADPITSPPQLPLWFSLGLRVIGLA